MQIPAGWLVDRFDVKWVFAAGFFLWSAATAVTGILHGFAALIVIRIILGLGESVAFPSYCKILGSHFTEGRRGFANAAIMAGLAIGSSPRYFVGGNVVGRFGWRPFFLVLGLASTAVAPAVDQLDAAPCSTLPPQSAKSPLGFSIFCDNGLLGARASGSSASITRSIFWLLGCRRT